MGNKNQCIENTDIGCRCTCTEKFGWMDWKKRRGYLPCQRMEPPIQRMPANFTVITPICSGFRWFPVLDLKKKKRKIALRLSVFLKVVAGLEHLGPGMETNSLNIFWFSGFPWLPFLNSTWVASASWRQLILVNQNCQLCLYCWWN